MNQIKGMSDLRMYELEDIAWDELDQIDDHIVPHPSNQHKIEPAYQEDSSKKLRHEVIDVSGNVDDSFTSKYVKQEEEGGNQPQNKKRTESLEKGSWLHSAGGVIPDSRDSGSSREMTTVSPDNVKGPNQSPNNSHINTTNAVFRANDTTIDQGCVVNDTNSCAYSLGDMTQNQNDLSFLDNDCEENGSADFLHYGWPDIENFEDVDRMFSNADDLSWLSSSYNIEEPEGILKSDFCPLINMPEEDLSKLHNASSLASESNLGHPYISCKSGFQGSELGKADPLGNMTFLNGSAISDRKEEFTPKEQQVVLCSSDVHFNNSTAYQPVNGNGQGKKQAKSEGKRKDRRKSRQVFAPQDHQKQKIAPNPCGYMQNPTPYMHLNYMHPFDQISGGSQLSEINRLSSVSPKESSYASNQAWSLKSSHGHPFSTPIMSVDDKLEKLRRRQGVYHSSVSEQVQNSQNEAENHNGSERVVVTNPADKNTSNAPETSSMSSQFDGISTDASSFHQLQQVMEQLDIRTKLCIRDSLYRLARSAEQRHRYANMKGGGFMDIETDTNPIDRSVAHLLFHRPTDSSVMAVDDGSSLKSHRMAHGSISSPPVMAEQLVCQEEAASEAKKKVKITDDG